MKNRFVPTALLVMEHNVTGMKYFCKTTLFYRIRSYKGSGVAWTKHLKEHGNDVKVTVHGFYLNEHTCVAAAKSFSVANNIVESDEWANLVIETGKIGAIMKGERNPFYGKTHTPETVERLRLQKIGKSVNKGAYQSPEKRAKISASLRGRSNPVISVKLKGRKLSEEHKAKVIAARKGYTHSMETKEKLRLASLAQWDKQRQFKSLPADEVVDG
jgi:hypothetical protein